MSTEDQDRLLGDLLVEKRRLKKDLKTLRKQLVKVGANIQALVNSFDYYRPMGKQSFLACYDDLKEVKLAPLVDTFAERVIQLDEINRNIRAIDREEEPS